jgi:hypothetical protein
MNPDKSPASCVARLRDVLLAQSPQAEPNARTVIRRKVRRLLADSGRKIVSQPFIADFDQALTAAKVFTHRSLIGRPLFQDEWLEFCLQPFPAHAVLFQSEHDLVEFMRRAIGVLPPLESLRPMDLRQLAIGREFVLPSRQRIDLLCEEQHQSGKGDLVAIEFKRGDPSYGVITQLDAYLDALSRHPIAQGRQARGLIISGPDDDGRSAAMAASRNRIDWYVYAVGLHKLERTSA